MKNNNIYLSIPPVFDHMDIVVDQCKSYDYGMNTLLAMEKGKIVLSGSEETAMDYLGFQNVPVINIQPNEEHIYCELEKIINLMLAEINNLKQEGKRFVKENHDLIMIASKFVFAYK